MYQFQGTTGSDAVSTETADSIEGSHVLPIIIRGADVDSLAQLSMSRAYSSFFDTSAAQRNSQIHIMDQLWALWVGLRSTRSMSRASDAEQFKITHPGAIDLLPDQSLGRPRNMHAIISTSIVSMGKVSKLPRRRRRPKSTKIENQLPYCPRRS